MQSLLADHFFYLYFSPLFPGFATCAHLLLLLSPHALSEMVPRKAFEARRGQGWPSPANWILRPHLRQVKEDSISNHVSAVHLQPQFLNGRSKAPTHADDKATTDLIYFHISHV